MYNTTNKKLVRRLTTIISKLITWQKNENRTTDSVLVVIAVIIVAVVVGFSISISISSPLLFLLFLGALPWP